METQRKPWWKDPRFIISIILIPIILGIFQLIPYIFPDKISNEIAVSMTLTDPRRAEAGLIETTIKNRFIIDDKSESQTANGIARWAVESIIADQPALKRERKKIPITVDHASDGTVFIQEPENKEATLHLGRFMDFKSLAELMATLEGANFNPAAQMSPPEPEIPTESQDIPAPDRKMRAGVYRIIVSAPGYKAYSIYLQLSDEGKLFTLSDDSGVVEINFPISFDLQRSSRDLRIAILPCNTSPPTSFKPKFAAIDQSIRSELVAQFKQKNFVPLLVEKKEGVGFDLNISKGLPPTEGRVSTDLLIENCRSEWLK